MSNYLTEQDVQNYGSDLIDFSTRAAAHALSPHLAALEQQQQQLRQQVAREQRARLDVAVEAAVPNFREIDRDPEWHRYLLGVDTLSGRVRQVLLNDAIAAGDAARVIQFFRQYQNSGETAGQTHGQTRRQTRAGAPSGNAQVYTNAMIADLYSRHRKGELTGPQWDAIEADIFRAQAEGRMATKPFLSK
jgi:hypothetical protein